MKTLRNKNFRDVIENPSAVNLAILIGSAHVQTYTCGPSPLQPVTPAGREGFKHSAEGALNMCRSWNHAIDQAWRQQPRSLSHLTRS